MEEYTCILKQVAAILQHTIYYTDGDAASEHEVKVMSLSPTEFEYDTLLTVVL